MNALVSELKTRARMRLNAVRKGGLLIVPPRKGPWRLRDALTLVAREAGFLNWAHALRVLSGHAQPGDDMGTLWHSRECHHFMSHWFADRARAEVFLVQSPHSVLLPYRRQFVGVDAHYLLALGVPLDDAAWQPVGRNLVAAYGGSAWQALCHKRLVALAPRAGVGKNGSDGEEVEAALTMTSTAL